MRAPPSVRLQEAWGVGVFADGALVRKGRWEDGDLVEEAPGTIDDFLNVYPKTALAARFIKVSGPGPGIRMWRSRRGRWPRS